MLKFNISIVNLRVQEHAGYDYSPHRGFSVTYLDFPNFVYP
jgi:hypothetical protein